jgi:hypothetical protein
MPTTLQQSGSLIYQIFSDAHFSPIWPILHPLGYQNGLPKFSNLYGLIPIDDLHLARPQAELEFDPERALIGNKLRPRI